jgi:hypothetical protein
MHAACMQEPSCMPFLRHFSARFLDFGASNKPNRPGNDN